MGAAASDLSVVVVSIAGGACLDRTLEALRAQEGGPPGEVLVAAGAGGPDPVSFAGPHPGARLLAAGGNVPERRARGLAAARGSVVALLEDSCVPAAGWARALLRAHASAETAAGGPVIPSPGLDPVSLAGCLVEFGGYLSAGVTECDDEAPPRAERALALRAPSLPGCNLSYPRSLLERERAVWEGGLHEIRLHARLRAAGVPLLLVPDARVVYGRPARLANLLDDRFHHGRLYGGEVRRGGAFRAAARAAAGPAVFGVLALRLLRQSAGPAWRVARPWASYPPALLALAAWTAGEAAGCLAGPGGSVEKWA